MKTTNDDNEGALGAYQVGARQAPSMTMVQWNSWAMYKKNCTKWWCWGFIKKRDWVHIWKTCRRLNGSGIEWKWHLAQAQADQWAADVWRITQAAKKCKCDAAAAKFWEIVPILDISHLWSVPCKVTVIELKLQLDWHQASGKSSKIHMRKDLKRKADLVKALINAIEEYNQRVVEMVIDDGESSCEDFEFDSLDSDSDSEQDTWLYFLLQVYTLSNYTTDTLWKFPAFVLVEEEQFDCVFQCYHVPTAFWCGGVDRFRYWDAHDYVVISWYELHYFIFWFIIITNFEFVFMLTILAGLCQKILCLLF